MCDAKECFLKEIGYWIDKKKKIFKRKIIMPQALTNSVRINRNNIGVFETVLSYDIEEQEKAYKYGDFYLDFDSTDFEEVREDVIRALSYIKIVFKIEYELLDIYYSGNKGMHIIVPAKVLGITPSVNLNEVFKTIAEAINDYTKNKTLDLRIYDNKRMFRMPNSIHEVTNRYKIILEHEEVVNMPLGDIINLAKKPRAIKERDLVMSLEANKIFKTFIERTEKRISSFKNIKSTGTLNYMPPCIKKILEDGAENGKRNNTLAILASYYKASGKDLNQALDLLFKWNEEVNGMPIPRAELIKTTRSIYSKDNAFGCSSIKTLELCHDSECKFKK